MLPAHARAWPEDIADFAPQAVELYSAEFVADLRKSFEIPGSLESEFFMLLARTTKQYLEWQTIRSQIVERKEVRTQLRSLARKSESAAKQLSNLLEMHGTALWNEYELLTRNVLTDENAPLRKIGAATERHDHYGGFEILTLQDALAAFSMISLVCSNAFDSLEPDKRGPKKNHPLVFWVQAYCEFWEIELGRKPTLDVHDGQMTSRTGAFLSSLIRPLDPDAEQSIPHAFAEARKR